MKKEYDFSTGRRGPVAAPAAGKQRITIRLDADIIEFFKRAVEEAGGGNYQTLINAALREYMNGKRMADTVREAVREAVHEEMKHAA
ncbi:MAG: BrnA antitoxin family protein [Mariprofundaceae bacterium]